MDIGPHLSAMSDQAIPPDQGGQRPPGPSVPSGSGAQASERIQVIIEAAERAAAGIIEDAEAQAQSYLEESRARADRIAAQRATKMWSLTDNLIERAEAVRRQSDELLRALDDAKRGVEEALEADAAVRFTPVEAPPQPDPPGQMPPLPDSPQQPPPPVQHLAAAPPPPAEPGPPPQPFSSPPPSPFPPPPLPQSAPEVQAPPPDFPPPADPPPQPFSSPPVPTPFPPPASAGPPAGNVPSEGARLLATQMAVAGSDRAEIESRLQNEFGIRDTGPMLDAILGPGH